jgi:SAM-dependent methyltransferase
MTQTPVYTFDNDRAPSADRFSHLAGMLDEVTTGRLAGLDLLGRRCLEVGAGGGSIAVWLADRVGPSGEVVATDVKPWHVPAHPNLTVLRHDITQDALPEGPWHLVHARLVLAHLPQRREVLSRLAGALAPGGRLLVEEWDGSYREGAVMAAPNARVAALYDECREILSERILPSNAADATHWARGVHGFMLDEGLVEVETVLTARSWNGGSPGALLMATNMADLRERFVEHGMSEADQDELAGYLADPRMVVRGQLTYSTMGTAP